MIMLKTDRHPLHKPEPTRKEAPSSNKSRGLKRDTVYYDDDIINSGQQLPVAATEGGRIG